MLTKEVVPNADGHKINVFLTVKPDILHKDFFKHVLHIFR